MGALPKVVLCFLLGAISLHQSEGMVSMKPFWKGWPFTNGFRHPNYALQGPSNFGLSILDDFNDIMWPFSSDLNKIHLRRDTQLPRGSWLKIEDEKNAVEKQFDWEEQQLQLKEDQLRKERQDLQARRKDNRRQEEQRRLQLEQKCMDEQKKLQQKEELRKEEQFRLAKVQQQQSEKKEAQIRQQREAKLRLEEQIRQQNELQKHERERREELRLREEKRQLEKQRLLLETERQERIRRDEERIKRQRAIEEREIRRRQQEEAHRQRQEEERIRRWRKEQDNQETSRRKSHLPRSEFGEINIPEGYNIDDITIQTVGNQAFIKGYHLCKCYEDCYDREFERRIKVPKNIDTRTITSSLHPNGLLSLRGVRYNQNIAPIDTSVDVEGVGLTPSDRDEDFCKGIGKKKFGFKLKKMNARTGEIFEDIEAMEDKQPKFETEVDEDGLTIEIEE